MSINKQTRGAKIIPLINYWDNKHATAKNGDSGLVKTLKGFVVSKNQNQIEDLITKLEGLTEEFINGMNDIPGQQIYHTRHHAREMVNDASLSESIIRQFFEESGYKTDNDITIKLLVSLVRGMFAAHDIIQDKGKNNEQESYKRYMEKAKSILNDAGIKDKYLLEQIDLLAKAVIVHGTTFSFTEYRTPIETYIASSNTDTNNFSKLQELTRGDPLVGFLSLWAALMDTKRMAARRLMEESKIHAESAAAQKDSIGANNSILAKLPNNIDAQLFVQYFGQNGRMMFELDGLAKPENKILDTKLLDKIAAWFKGSENNIDLTYAEKLDLYDFIMHKITQEIAEGGFSNSMSKQELDLKQLSSNFRLQFNTTVDIADQLDSKVWSQYVSAASGIIAQIKKDVTSDGSPNNKKFEFVDDFLQIAFYQQGRAMDQMEKPTSPHPR